MNDHLSIESKNPLLKKSGNSLSEENLNLKRQIKDLQHLIYNIAHNLRAPVASVMGIIQLAVHEEGHDQSTYFNMMEGCLKKMDSEIQNVLNYTQNSSSFSELSEINIEELAYETWRSLQFMPNADNIHFNLENLQTKKLISDPNRLQIIFVNLLSNAIKYHEPDQDHAYISIRAYNDDINTYLEIKDNGEGMCIETQNKVFEMFFRGSSKSEGTGLGMYIVKEAVQMIEGSIHVTSTPGEGSAFQISLPLRQSK